MVKKERSMSEKGRSSKRKGKAGELEFAHLCIDNGIKSAKRSQQYNGKGKGDVEIPDIHVEVKRTETLRLWNAMDQAKEDKKEGEVAIVAHRPSRKEWIIIMNAEDWFPFYHSWIQLQKKERNQIKLEEF